MKTKTVIPMETACTASMSDAEIHAIAEALHSIALSFEKRHCAQLRRYYTDLEEGLPDAAKQLSLPLSLQNQ